ncbi:MAG: alanine racemase [Candidatus Omnitrophica bacterium]|nr:alanine racemase [Candidatus Omnitrophota bacterium]
MDRSKQKFSVKEAIHGNVWIEISLANLRHNVNVIRDEVGPGVSTMGVVKSNAYGHGIREVASFLEDKVEIFGVADLEEALQIREAGLKNPILIFGFIFPEEVSECLEKNISVSVSSLEQAEALSREAARFEKTLKIHVKVDTGMGRMGIPADEAVESILAISKLPNLVIEGLMTHFAVADQMSNPFTKEQINGYRKILNALELSGLKIPFKHLANTSGIFNFKESHFNLVRPGISLYGVGDKRLKSVMSLKAKVHLVKKLPKGHSVSYGQNFRLPKEGFIAVLPIGYGHGYPYSLTGKSGARVLIGGKSYPIAGNICMDYTLIYLGEKTDVRAGDEAVLIGSQGNESISTGELGALTSTIPYEIMTRQSHDIERWYVE